MKRRNAKIILVLFASILMFGFSVFKSNASQVPALNFSDIDSGPKTGNTDGVGSGAIVTVWGNYLGSSQGTSKIYVGNVEVMAIYYWKDADGTLPGGPADLKTYHKMQEIAFAIPASATDGLNTIKVVVNGFESNILPFTVRSGNVYFIKSSGNDSTGNGSWSNPWQTLQNVFNGGNGKIAAGDIIYSAGVGSNNGINIGAGGPIKGTLTNPVSLIAYPNTSVSISGKAYSGYVIFNFWGYNSSLSSEYINISKFSVTAAGNGNDSSSGIDTFKGNRIIGVEITGPTVYGGYGGAITGSGGGNGSGSGEHAGGGKYYGIYIHNYGYKSTTTGVNNYGWSFDSNANTWTSPPYDGIGDACTNCTSVDRFQHLYYISDRSPDAIEGYEIGWNYLVNNPILQGIHIYDQGPNIGGWTSPIIIHDNVVKNQQGNSIDVVFPNADVGPNAGTAAPVYIYNNIIINDPGNTVNGTALNIQGAPAVKIYNNTIYGYRFINIIRPSSSDYRNNIMIEGDVPLDYHYYIYDTPTSKSNNLFYGTHSLPIPSWFSSGNGDLNVDPLFNNLANGDFSLQSTSSAKYGGSDIVLSTTTRDFFGQIRPSGKVSMGAIEYQQISFEIYDFINLVSNWFQRTNTLDLNPDGIINTKDLGIMMSKWN